MIDEFGVKIGIYLIWQSMMSDSVTRSLQKWEETKLPALWGWSLHRSSIILDSRCKIMEEIIIIFSMV